ncbi:DUF3553 domain-containing protein [Roseovarius sp. M141]|uniref:DUF3553 domain-containing protein n=1 Tax=Roseovarius sp. M141 TaxID=2583806 RepID=UPI0020CED1CA|nr:DUF3553 domain-containing protein [Roseovarius sp. M141]MCQ0092836.1 DUF3553 domain-containing protein [Roseovarius sp. M141]
MSDFAAFLEPGMRVEAPSHPDWGVGQVQSNVAGRVTVNFPDMGKMVIETSRVMLLPVFDR